MFFEKLEFNKFSDGRGDLVPLEFGADFKNWDIPFDVKRCYFISAPTNDDGAVRGKHAHFNLEQVIICLHGSFRLDLENQDGLKKSFMLSKPNEGIHIKKGLVWRELKNFSSNCVALVLSSEHYDKEDYIRNYDEFKELPKVKN